MLNERKRLAREQALAVRAGWEPGLGSKLAAVFLRDINDIPPIVAGFWPLAGEIDISPLLVALTGLGHQVALPVTPPRGTPLVFRRWTPGQILRPGRFGTQHPDGPELRPDMVLVPLLAFDRQGNRLGYGAGYYDRTLRLLPDADKIGCAFACQEMESVPVGPDDEKLGAIVTENELIPSAAQRQKK